MMNAASFDVKVHGEVVENGATITHTSVEVDNPVLYVFEMDPHIEVVNNEAATKNFDVAVKAISVAANEDANPSSLMFCIGSCMFLNKTGQEVSLPLIVEANSSSADASPAPHIAYTPANITDPDTYENIYLYGVSEFQFTVTSGSESITFNVVFDYNEASSGIDGVELDNAPAEYFNMQGVRVANPEKGFYIVRRGNKVSKEFVR